MEDDIGKKLVQALKDPNSIDSQESVAKAMEAGGQAACEIVPFRVTE